MSSTNLILFGYDSTLANKLVDVIITHFTQTEKLNFSKKLVEIPIDEYDNNDELQNGILIHESKEIPSLKIINISDNNIEYKNQVFEHYKSIKDNIFLCVFSTEYRLKDQDKIYLKNIYTSVEKFNLNNFFCIIDTSSICDDELSYYDDYIRGELGFIFQKKSYFDFQKYQSRVFFLDLEQASVINSENFLSKRLEQSNYDKFITELKNFWNQIREENPEEVSQALLETEVFNKPIPQVQQLTQIIDNIIKQRNQQASIISKYIENINKIDEGIKELSNGLNNLSQHPQLTQDLKMQVQDFGRNSIYWNREIMPILEQLENAKKRFSRQAITIGCSGQARVGKSTLLQTIGNLPEEAIPTGKGIPVTAVRSLIRHSHERKAILSLRDKNNFLEELVKPFHRELNLSVVNSIEEFKNFDYNRNNLATDKNVELLGRLRQMQAAISSYENYLTGEKKIIEDLTKLRPWVAYPQQQEKDPNCSRLYLAVKNIEIKCSFLLDVEKLVLVDLPGLGEVNLDAEEHHVQALKNEVDLVLLILRPTAQSSYWGNKDRKALNLIAKAVEGVSKLGDFVFIVVNNGEQDDKELYQILINDIHRQLNENQPDSRYKVLTCNAIDPDNVKEEVLFPALNHLIARLPVMDEEIVNSIFSQWQAVVEKISTAIYELETSLRKIPSQTTSMNGTIYDKAKLLRQELAIKLANNNRELREEIQSEKDEGSITDNKLVEAIKEKHQEIRIWAKNGLGTGEKDWYDQARGRFDIDKTVDAFAVDEINRARAYLTDTYSQLDIYFETKIEELWIRISNIISACTGNLIADVPAGKEALERLLLLLEGKESNNPFPSLQEATKYLLKCGEENAIFQSHLLPRLIEETQKLAPERLIFTNISCESKDAEKRVLEMITGKIIQTSYAVQKILREKPFVSNILYSAAVKFEDSLVRSTDADRQFFDFALSYTNYIWVNEFKAIENNYMTVKTVDNAITQLKQLLNISIQR
ncbi:dynamin family protein [Calothrix sp. CCY 0018]|uniref:dynamin family protein n=1 Tax=Calothrix sp. CCY 0018 TaxID=3103864 RepID=UPI0039C715B4